MILVFGGTTEGRKVVEELEDAGSPYFYSTRTDGQQIDLVHGIHLTGGMDLDKMTAFCDAHGIRLIIDAAHPFAEDLHQNVLLLAHQRHLPLIRFDRIYPPRTDNVVWCKDYQDAIRQLESHGIGKLLVLTGVNTIGKLRDYWSRHECRVRILHRQASLAMARKVCFPEDHLVYYEDDDTPSLIARYHPQAILTKESGESGGYEEKVRAAHEAGIQVFVVERPEYPPSIAGAEDVALHRVNGPHGLRRAVEHLLPEFYPLHSGLTTGTCATAAAIAATRRLLLGEKPLTVPVVLPNGETISVDVEYGEDYASVMKESGDDPDVTNGLEIRAEVSQLDEGETTRIEIVGGEGVGIFTLPGFDYPPGEPAINKAPREMIRRNLQPFGIPLRVIISVPRGAEIARRTFNPRLGIEGGISIIGVSGIVKPFSEEAFLESIHKCLEVARASGADRVVINSGAKSERFVKAVYPDLPQQAFVEYGNYIGETLKMASELGIKKVTLGVMLGKAVKLAAGQLDTHSKRGTMDKEFISQMLDEAGCPLDLSTLTLARDLWKMIPPAKTEAFCHVVIGHCMAHCAPLLGDGQLSILLIGEDGEIHPVTPQPRPSSF